MPGHVNVMDDFLISNLPPEYLRSALRTLLAHVPAAQPLFVEHVRSRLQEAPPALTPPKELFPAENVASDAAVRYQSLTRCVFSSKQPVESIKYLVHFIESVWLSCATWTDGSPLVTLLSDFSGDVVQAMQALKQGDPPSGPVLRENLTALSVAFASCKAYCTTNQLSYPFGRAERQAADTLALFFPDAPNVISAGAHLNVNLPPSKQVETFTLGGGELPRLFNGLWQLSSAAFGAGTAQGQLDALARLLEKGLTAADMADHYGDAELVYGDFRNRLAPDVKEQVYAATKWCVFKPIGIPVTRDYVLSAVRERSRRLGGRVDLLQFHWHDYAFKEYLQILHYLVDLTTSTPDLVSAIGLCNFDSEHTAEVCEYLLQHTGKVGIVSNQVQFSPIDTRPFKAMIAVCAKYNLKLLTYGSLCGGLLSNKWLNQPLPDVYSSTNPLNPSQKKYVDMISNWGTWDDFQSLLGTLNDLAEHQGVTIADVATRWVLQQKTVGAVLVGTRLGVTDRCADALNIDWTLSEPELAAIDWHARGKDGERANALYDKIGDCGQEYRGANK